MSDKKQENNIQITIKNCNAIDEATINITLERLNIKYGINGTGKTSISKMIEFDSNLKKCEKNSAEYNKYQGEINNLTPFKNKQREPQQLPSLECEGDFFKKVKIFNEEYINLILFKPDEEINNSFDIFINDEEYKKNKDSLDNFFEEINKISSNQTFNSLLEKIVSFEQKISINKDGTLSAKSSWIKATANGDIIENIPEPLKEYKQFITSPQNVDWATWHAKGKDFSKEEHDSSCPYCVTTICTNKKEKINAVNSTYKKDTIKNLSELKRSIEEFKDFISNETFEKINDIIQKTFSSSTENKDHQNFLHEFYTQLSNLKEKLISIKNVNNDIKNIRNKENLEKIEDFLRNYTIDLSCYSHFKSEKVATEVSAINKVIDDIIIQGNQLKGKINLYKQKIQTRIKDATETINNFMKNAGYPYQITTTGENEESKFKLKHIDADKVLENSKNHLSYGEKNAFALFLFMYECIKEESDLIILDDPISSFDQHKKYSIMHHLFGKNGLIVNKTVLMFTHDIEVLIDLVKTKNRDYYNKITCHFLNRYLQDGQHNLSEQKITFEDLKVCTDLWEDKIKNCDTDILKIIYLRKYYELKKDEGFELVYSLLSSLIHLRKKPTHKSGTEEIDLLEDEIATIDLLKEDEIATSIKKINSDFNLSFTSYEDLYKELTLEKLLSCYADENTSNYEKLNICRFIIKLQKCKADDTFYKFITESFHIENDMIMQLSPDKFDCVPYYIIQKCDELVEASKQKLLKIAT